MDKTLSLRISPPSGPPTLANHLGVGMIEDDLNRLTAVTFASLDGERDGEDFWDDENSNEMWEEGVGGEGGSLEEGSSLEGLHYDESIE